MSLRKHTKLNIGRTDGNPLRISVTQYFKKRETSKINKGYKIFHAKRFSGINKYGAIRKLCPSL